jgi:cytochrome c oxidase subunit III
MPRRPLQAPRSRSKVADSRFHSLLPAEHSHFDSLERRADAGRFAMWVFLASEVLFFGGLFALYFSYRLAFPHAFAEGIQKNTLWPASVNTLVLLVSSFAVAVAVDHLRHGRERHALRFVLVTAALGAAFIGIKAYEYSVHFAHGVFPGGDPGVPNPVPASGSAVFHTLYFAMTGLHAIHVFVGIGMLAVFAWLLRTARLRALEYHRLEIGALYWHLVDIVWLFLWPLFYLTGRAA